MNVQDVSEHYRGALSEVNKVLVGQDELLDYVLTAMLAGGHVLIEGVPGLGKTLLVRAFSHVLGAAFKRIQFTPDLMPSDVTGGNVFNQKEDRFVFVPGPVFTELLLADEINRAPAKTQSALLEAMQEGTVTIDGQIRPLPSPFLVIATQNPVESHGTYPLPEAQLDRFLLKVDVKHPSFDAEKQILQNRIAGFDPNQLEQYGLRRILTPPGLLSMRQVVASVRVDEGIVEYITKIVRATRSHRSVYLGASTRGAIALLACARVRAVSEGRDFVIPDDVKSFAFPALRHRLLLHPEAELEGVSPDDCVEAVLRETSVPKTVA